MHGLAYHAEAAGETDLRSRTHQSTGLCRLMVETNDGINGGAPRKLTEGVGVGINEKLTSIH